MQNSLAPQSTAHRQDLFRWLFLAAAAFGGLAMSMGWVANTVDVASPVGASLGATDGAAPADGPVADFRLQSLDGQLVGPPDFLGQVVLVEFWATWCGPCRLQANILEELHAEFDGQVQFLAVDSGESESTVRTYVEKTPFPYPVLLDPQDSLSAQFRIYGLPTVMVIDKQGRIVFQETGVTPADALRAQFRAAGAA